MAWKISTTVFSFLMSKPEVCILLWIFMETTKTSLSNVPENSSGKIVPPSWQKKISLGCCTFGTSQPPFKITLQDVASCCEPEKAVTLLQTLFDVFWACSLTIPMTFEPFHLLFTLFLPTYWSIFHHKWSFCIENCEVIFSIIILRISLRRNLESSWNSCGSSLLSYKLTFKISDCRLPIYLQNDN